MSRVRVHILGVRGSTPAPGPAFVRYGGHTSCLALAHDGEAPSLLIDAGTGIRRVSALLEGKPFVGTVLLGHLHWDHTQGLPFFRAGDSPGAEVALFAPAQPDGEVGTVLSRAAASLTDDDPSACQAWSARFDGPGTIVPSAALPSTKNLVLIGSLVRSPTACRPSIQWSISRAIRSPTAELFRPTCSDSCGGEARRTPPMRPG